MLLFWVDYNFPLLLNLTLLFFKELDTSDPINFIINQVNLLEKLTIKRIFDLFSMILRKDMVVIILKHFLAYLAIQMVFSWFGFFNDRSMSLILIQLLRHLLKGFLMF